MNVLFDDGHYLDRVLAHDPLNPYDAYSEAFQFYKFIDNIWGDFRTRDMEETRFANTHNQVHTGNNPLLATHPGRYNHFRENYFLKLIPFTNHRMTPTPPAIFWQSLPIIDIVQFLPINVLNQPHVIGVAFSIYKREVFNQLDGIITNREKTSSFYLAIRLVTRTRSRITPPRHDITVVNVNDLIQERWNPRYDLTPPENDNQALYRLAPTLVLNKDTILHSRNYTGDWAGFTNPLQPDIWNTPAQHTHRMVIRIGRDCERYILFLHGDHEAGCPIRIPTD